jgi:hypothetical protein
VVGRPLQGRHTSRLGRLGRGRFRDGHICGRFHCGRPRRLRRLRVRFRPDLISQEADDGGQEGTWVAQAHDGAAAAAATVLPTTTLVLTTVITIGQVDPQGTQDA